MYWRTLCAAPSCKYASYLAQREYLHFLLQSYYGYTVSALDTHHCAKGTKDNTALRFYFQRTVVTFKVMLVGALQYLRRARQFYKPRICFCMNESIEIKVQIQVGLRLSQIELIQAQEEKILQPIMGSKGSIQLTRQNLFVMTKPKKTRIPKTGTVISFFFLGFSVSLLLFFQNSMTPNGPIRNVDINLVSTPSREDFKKSISPFSSFIEVDKRWPRPRYQNPNPVMHQTNRAAHQFLFDDYLLFQKRNRLNSSRVLIYRPSITGIGDRLSILAYTYWIASVSRRVLLVDWKYPFPLSQLLVNANEDIDFFFHEKMDDPKNETRTEISNANMQFLDGTAASLRQYDRVVASNARTVVLATNKRPAGITYGFVRKHLPKGISIPHILAQQTSLSFYRVLFHSAFKLSRDIREEQHIVNTRIGLTKNFSPEESRGGSRVGDCNQSKGCHFITRPYIGVHARIGLGVGESSPRFAKISQRLQTPANCLASRAVKISLITGNPPLPIYLATDTPAFRQVFETTVSKFSKGKVKVFTGDWKTIHTARIRYDIDGRVPGPIQMLRMKEAVRDSYMDMVILGDAKHVISLYSSFSRFAMTLGMAETLTEIRNEICFKDEQRK